MTEVRVPSVEHTGVYDLVPSRGDTRADLITDQRRLTNLLPCHGYMVLILQMCSTAAFTS